MNDKEVENIKTCTQNRICYLKNNLYSIEKKEIEQQELNSKLNQIDQIQVKLTYLLLLKGFTIINRHVLFSISFLK